MDTTNTSTPQDPQVEAQIQAALPEQDGWDEPEQSSASEAVALAEPEAETELGSDQTPTDPTDSSEPAEQPKASPKGLQKRISKLSARNHALQAEIEALKAKLAPPPPADDGKPRPEAFGNLEEYTEALVSWKLERTQSQTKPHPQPPEGRVAPQGAPKDFFEVIDAVSDIQLPQELLNEITQVGPRFAYFLAKNPALLEEMSEAKSARQAMRLLDQAEETFKARTKIKPRSAEQAPVEASGGTSIKPRSAATAARGGSGSASGSGTNSDPGESYSSWLAKRNEELRRGRGR